MKRLLIPPVVLLLSFPVRAQTFVKWSFESRNLTPVFDYAADHSSRLLLVGSPDTVMDKGLGASRYALKLSRFPAQPSAGPTGIELLVSTEGKNGIVLSWEMKAEAGASRYYQVFYTTNKGSNWIPVDITAFNTTVNGGGKNESNDLLIADSNSKELHAIIDFSSIHTIDNNDRFGLRICAAASPQTGQYQPVSGAAYDPDAAVWLDNIAIGRNSALPIKVSAFYASGADGTGIELAWSTESEEGFSHFEPERSADGIYFERLGTVKAQGQSGTTRYTFTDHPTSGGPFLYRLRTVDLDSTGQYSATIRVFASVPERSLVLYPNPAGASLQLSEMLKAGSGLLLLDLQGRVLLRMTLTEDREQLSLPVAQWPPGSYLLQFRYGEECYTRLWEKR